MRLEERVVGAARSYLPQAAGGLDRREGDRLPVDRCEGQPQQLAYGPVDKGCDRPAGGRFTGPTSPPTARPRPAAGEWYDDDGGARAGSGSSRPRADRDPPGPGDRAAPDRGRPLDGPGPVARRAAAAALPGRPARGTRRRDGPGPDDDAQGVGRRARARRRQGGDARRRRRLPPRGPARRRGGRDRRAGWRLHHSRGHRHHHRRHGPHGAAHATWSAARPTPAAAATPPPSPPRRCSRRCAAVSRPLRAAPSWRDAGSA